MRIAALGLAAALAFAAPAAPASADVAPDQDAADALRISATMSDGSDTLSPGDSFDWTVDIAAAEDLAGTIDRELVVDGALAPHVSIALVECAAACGAATALDFEAGSATDLGSQTAPGTHTLAFTVTLDADAPHAVTGLSGSLALRATGFGETATVVPGDDAPASQPTPGPLVRTDGETLPWLLVAGAIALGAWFLTAASRRRRAEPAPAEIAEEQTS